MGGTSESVQDVLQNALLNIVGKPQIELEHVDIGASLDKHGLASLFPEEVSMRTFPFFFLFAAPVVALCSCGLLQTRLGRLLRN